ncbi:MAG: hypothetical protein BGP24_09460 [Lysobacterales bacterium 69-70]|nr:hypothetical protein [Xanthomonadaceae bacterium]ODU33186.1 MAG: hypothetical protein ABS97_12485 [Xanthomonadaceae bacterium SCN 69-320]ODV20487.1 MAG: hypothetical protein ABT27_07185 [Xanthomonadaceae bacterium SCN 69-25]OJZ00731.1 MAG: hypothetical protein BGP24_09460 [Xanthomonadales bacterium 69-70]
MIRSSLHAACAAGLVCVLACGAASAQEPASSYTDRLVVDDGMTPIADGLYAQSIGTTESYVAVGPAGHQALLKKLRELRRMPTKDGVASASGPIEELTSLLSSPVPLNQDVYGDCTGVHPGASGPFEARALAGGGVGGGPYGASGIAANNSSPTIATKNRVYVTVYDADGIVVGQQETITYGNTLAVASAYAPQGRGCSADSLATVTCPGATRPAITAVAHNLRCTIH